MEDISKLKAKIQFDVLFSYIRDINECETIDCIRNLTKPLFQQITTLLWKEMKFEVRPLISIIEKDEKNEFETKVTSALERI